MLKGQGVHAVYLAQQGFSVVAVDFVSAALAAARTRAEQAGVEVELLECDVHFAHRPRALWLPKGPRHMTRDEAVAFFAPLELQAA